MSTLMPASASGWKTAGRDARLVRDLDERDLGDVAVVGQPANLVPLLHERVLLDERAGGVLERAEDLDDDAVHPAELDGPRLHDLGALVGELEHLLVADDVELAGGRDEPRVGSVDAADVGEDLAAVGAEARGERDRGRVRAAPAERRDVGRVSVGRRRLVASGPGSPATITTLPASISRRIRAGSMLAIRALPWRLSVVMPACGPLRLIAGDAQGVEGHRDERRALVLAGREEHVELALVGRLGDRRGQAEQLVGRVAHRRNDDDEVGAGGALAGDPAGHTPDSIRVGEAGATEFLNDEGAGRHLAHSTPHVQPLREGRGRVNAAWRVAFGCRVGTYAPIVPLSTAPVPKFPQHG